MTEEMKFFVFCELWASAFLSSLIYKF